MLKDISSFLTASALKKVTAKHTPIDTELEAVARSCGFPYKYVIDFIRYQNKRGWKINGEPIRNRAAIFTAWARARMQKRFVDPDLLNVP